MKTIFTLDFFITIIVNLGGATIISIAVIKWLSNMIQKKLTLSWTQQNNKEIELLKASLKSSQEVVKLSISSMAINNQLTMSKCIDAVDLMWKSILKIREQLSPISTFFSVLMPNEYNKVIKERPDAFQLSKISDDSFREQIKEIDKTEEYRPYLGEYLWSLFFSYRAFMYRNLLLFQSGSEKGNIKPWYEDRAVVDIARNYLGEDQFSKVSLENINSFPLIVSMLEQKLLVETSKIISGSNLTENNYMQAKRLMELSMKEKID